MSNLMGKIFGHKNKDANHDGIPDNLQKTHGMMDANRDGIPDKLQRHGGATDANRDGIPDNLQKTHGFMDANRDGIPDRLQGGMTDANRDGIPDNLQKTHGFMDANRDGIPDKLQKHGGMTDANRDGIPDQLQRGYGTTTSQFASNTGNLQTMGTSNQQFATGGTQFHCENAPHTVETKVAAPLTLPTEVLPTIRKQEMAAPQIQRVEQHHTTEILQPVRKDVVQPVETTVVQPVIKEIQPVEHTIIQPKVQTVVHPAQQQVLTQQHQTKTLGVVHDKIEKETVVLPTQVGEPIMQGVQQKLQGQQFQQGQQLGSNTKFGKVDQTGQGFDKYQTTGAFTNTNTANTKSF